MAGRKLPTTNLQGGGPRVCNSSLGQASGGKHLSCNTCTVTAFWGVEVEVKGWPDFVLVTREWSHNNGFLFLGTLRQILCKLFYMHDL